VRRECDRLSKTRHKALESESEALLTKKASMCKKRALEPESEALLRKEHDREHLKLMPSAGQCTEWFYTMFAHSFVNPGDDCTSLLLPIIELHG